MNSQHNYPEMITWLEQKGKKDFGDKFHFLEQDITNITKLICYFINDEIMAAKFDIDLTKGILLCGPVGCGKTTLMMLMRYVTQQNNKFDFT